MRSRCIAAVFTALMILAGGVALAQPAPSPAPAALSLSLPDALQMALANNLTYRAAGADAVAAQARLIQARGGLFPSLSTGYSYVHTQNAGVVFFPVPQPSGPPLTRQVMFSATDINNVNATLQYAIYSGGAVQAAIGQAAAGYAAAQSNLAAAKANVINETTDAYFALVLAARTAAIDDEAVGVAQENLKTSNQLYSAGTVARADVLRQEVTLANAQLDAVRAHNNADLANARLANVLNINLSSIISPSEALEAHMPTYALDEVINDAQTRRPEVAAAIDAVTIAERAVQSARAGTLPTVSLQVSDASSKPNFVNVPQPQLSETLAVVWKLFDGGLTHGKVAEASAMVDKAKINLQQERNGVDLEVRQAFFNYRAALSEVVAAASARVAAAENLRVTQLRYRSGVGTALELSDALLSYTQTQVQLAAALAGARTALVALQRAAGLL